MNDKRDKVFEIFLALPTIVCIIILGCNGFKLCTSDWIALISSTVASTCTVLLGLAVFFQSENHRKRQDHDKAQEEIEDKRRRQDLMIRTNPLIYLNGIRRFEYNDMSCIIDLSKDKNNLSDVNPSGKGDVFECFFSIDLVFKNNDNRNTDYITINNATLICSNGEFLSEGYKEFIKVSVKNHSEGKSLIKISPDGDCIALLMLFSKILDEEKDTIAGFMQLGCFKWLLTLDYTMSNSFNVAVNCSSQIIFALNPSQGQNGIYQSVPEIKDIVTWRRSEIYIEE